MRRAAGCALTLLLLAATAASSPSRAAVEDDGWEIELYVGQYSPGPSEVDSDTIWGLRVGRNVGDRWNLFADFGPIGN